MNTRAATGTECPGSPSRIHAYIICVMHAMASFMPYGGRTPIYWAIANPDHTNVQCLVRPPYGMKGDCLSITATGLIAMPNRMQHHVATNWLGWQSFHYAAPRHPAAARCVALIKGPGHRQIPSMRQFALCQWLGPLIC